MELMTFHELIERLTVLYTEGKHAEALELLEQNAAHFPEQVARTTYR